MDIGNGTRESHKSTNFIKTTKNKKDCPNLYVCQYVCMANETHENIRR